MTRDVWYGQYVGHEQYYAGGFDEAKHRELAETLNGCSGRVVLSYYPSPLLDELYPAKRWLRTYHDTVATAAGNFKRDPGAKPQRMKAGLKRTELILSNFNPNTSRRLK